MSNISELANVPQISFIENMTLQETEEQLKAEYARIYREQTGKELVLGEADAKTLLLKAFALIEYQTMQYADIKGQAELLKTSTGEALDALVALLGLTRQESKKATAKERFLLAEARADTVAVPAGTRVKTQGGRYFNTLDYAEIPPGATYVDTIVQAEEAGAESSGILAGEINILVDPIPYIASVSNVDESTGGLDVEDDDSLTERAYLAPSRFSCAGPRDAYEYHVREWRSDVTDVQITSPEPCVIAIYFVMEGGRLPNATEREELAEYISGENLRPLCDKVVCVEPEEVPYNIAFTYWIGGLKIHYYIRYMDDVIILGQDKETLHRWKAAVETFLREELALDLNSKTSIRPVCQGVEFVGVRIWPTHMKLRKSTVRRIKREVRKISALYAAGDMTRQDFYRRIASIRGLLKHTESASLRWRLNEIYRAELEKAKQKQLREEAQYEPFADHSGAGNGDGNAGTGYQDHGNPACRAG